MMWKVIEDYPNYSVSDKGNVKNVLTSKILKQSTDRVGYKIVNLCKDNGRKHQNQKIHRLVALYFIDNPDVDNYHQVDHKNGDKADNRACNLRWCNASLNGQNRKLSSRNKSGVKGVSYNTSKERWQTSINIEGKQYFKYSKDKNDVLKWRQDMIEKHYNKDFYKEN